jgi:hypothetical protein
VVPPGGMKTPLEISSPYSNAPRGQGGNWIDSRSSHFFLFLLLFSFFGGLWKLWKSVLDRGCRWEQ